MVGRRRGESIWSTGPVRTISYAWHGLPAEVRRLSAALFGEMSGAFDSAHGLGDEFTSTWERSWDAS